MDDELVEIVDNMSRIGRPLRGIAETEACTVVAAGTRETCHGALDVAKRYQVFAQASFKDDRRRAFAQAEKIQPSPMIDIDQGMCVGVFAREYGDGKGGCVCRAQCACIEQ